MWVATCPREPLESLGAAIGFLEGNVAAVPFTLRRALHVGGRHPAGELVEVVVVPHDGHPIPGVVSGVAVHLERPAACQGHLCDDLRLTGRREPPDAPRRQLRFRIGKLVGDPVQLKLRPLLDSCHPPTKPEAPHLLGGGALFSIYSFHPVSHDTGVDGAKAIDEDGTPGRAQLPFTK